MTDLGARGAGEGPPTFKKGTFFLCLPQLVSDEIFLLKIDTLRGDSQGPKKNVTYEIK